MPNAAKPSVLTTRPAAMQGALMSALNERGFKAIPLPLLEIIPEDLENPSTPGLQSKLFDLDLYQHIIVVSRNAARIAIDLLDQLWPQLPIGVEWHAIGKGTAEELTRYDIRATTNEGLDSEALLTLPAFAQPSGERILIFKGIGGRTLLEETLAERGAKVETINLYQRQMPEYSDAELTECFKKTPGAILISSGEALEHLAKLADEWGMFADTPIFVPSQRVADLGNELGFTDITVANGADDSAMIAALEQRFQ
jgi:uroporphyrinogen-III synthase